MQRSWFLTAVILGCMMSEPALACRMYSPQVLEDVRHADVVLVGRISDYRIIRDEAFRQRMLNNPNLTAEDRARYEGPQSLLPDYARFEVTVDEVLEGQVPDHLSVTWDNSTFGEPDTMATGPFLMALRMPNSVSPPLRGPSTTFFPNAEAGLFTLLQAPCSSTFLFDVASDEATQILEILDKPHP